MDKESCSDVTVSRYRIRKEKGLCPRCGKPNNSGFVACEKCREEEILTKRWYESHGFCPICHNESAPKHKLCEVCLVKTSERNAKRRSKMTVEQKKRQAESAERTRRKHIEQGLCGKCGKRPSWGGRQLCYECTLKQRRQNRKKNTIIKTRMGALDAVNHALKENVFALSIIKFLAIALKKQENLPHLQKLRRKTKRKLMLCGVK